MRKFTYQFYSVVGQLLIVAEPYGWISVIDLKKMECIHSFLAYERKGWQINEILNDIMQFKLFDFVVKFKLAS